MTIIFKDRFDQKGGVLIPEVKQSFTSYYKIFPAVKFKL